MEQGHLSDIPNEGNHIQFSDEIKDDLQVEGVKLTTCHFRRVGLKKAMFTNSKLTQCLFEDVYLRNASFDDVEFIGSKFRGCNLEKVEMSKCKFKYCTFDKTFINRDEIIANLPIESNLRRDLARNLKKNFESIGDKESADVFLDIEIQAQEEDWEKAWKSKEDYYRKHYPNWTDKFKAKCKSLLSKTSGVIWGYGHRIHRLLSSYLILTFVIGIIIFLFQSNFSFGNQCLMKTLGFWQSIYYTFAETLGISHFTPVSVFGNALKFCLGLIRTLFLPLLAATLYRRIAR